MPKRNTEEYEDDGGFVEDAPKSKYTANSKKQKRSTHNPTPAGSESVPGGGHAGSDGEFWELSGKRRVQISKFNGKQMLSIREYYEKDGQMLPGKKGISLTLEQFDIVVALLPHIESVLKEKGHVLKRPDYQAAAIGVAAEQDGDEDEATIDEDKINGVDPVEQSIEKPPAKVPGRKNAIADNVGRKKNYDDTSEDE